MASRRNQILIASAIWVGVCTLGWHAYANVLPKYGLIRRTVTRPGAQDWQNLQKEQEAFYKESVPWWTRISISRSEPGRGMSIGGLPREQNGAYYYFATNQKLSDTYASLTGTERWQISELPKLDERWDIRIKAPLNEKKSIPAAFLKKMGWSVRSMASTLDGYRFTAGTPPANPSPPDVTGPRRAANIPSMRLGNARGMIAGRINAPVEIDKSVRDQKPPGNANLQLNWGLPPEKFVNQVASIYGVAVQKTSVDTTSVLVYQPKKASQEEMQRWVKDGKI
ncbi:MAG: hypothetical protein ACR2IE_13290 [Candidatus Sumerlaeaceae bacterium]